MRGVSAFRLCRDWLSVYSVLSLGPRLFISGLCLPPLVRLCQHTLSCLSQSRPRCEENVPLPALMLQEAHKLRGLLYFLSPPPSSELTDRRNRRCSSLFPLYKSQSALVVSLK